MMSAQQSNGVAAFFDIDGTLLPWPSLEWRLVRWLISQRAIPIGSSGFWLANAARLAPRGIEMMRHANKLYLRGINAAGPVDETLRRVPPRRTKQAGMTVPRFFPAGIEQIAWHAVQGHAIFLISGTLEVLAREVALALTVLLAIRGVAARIGLGATRLEEIEGRWTGKILGEPIFGEAKARTIRRLAFENKLHLQACYAYANGWSDRWMLEAVGRSVAVNPDKELRQLARVKEWPIFWWRQDKEAPQTTKRTHRNTEQIWGNLG
jgi:HAD superfamily hydrolase (TIGR01490 family)